jgi:Phytanoyl-CoA dioxygenase (PhyH)
MHPNDADSGRKHMEHLVLSSQERSAGKLNPETLERGCNQVMLNGFVLVANALSTDFVDKIYEDWIDLANHLLENDPEKTDVGSTEFRKKRIRMDTPFRDPYTDPRLVANSFAMPIIERILGEDCRVCYYSADAPLPGSDYQVVHADYKPFFPDSDVVLPTAGLVVNFPLIEVTEGNGPMDVWPNSHLLPEKAYSAARISDAARSIEPTKMLTPKGSMLIRDVRMWHRGTPNMSNQIRPNLALIYTRSWWDGAFYPQDSLGITRTNYEGLPERAKQLFRLEPVAD